MPVTLICPACDNSVPADATSGSVQCPTCWAKVSVEAARRKPTDTPPPKAPSDAIPTARRADKTDDPPRAKRADRTERRDKPRRTRSRREESPKSSGVIWAVAALVLVLVTGAGIVVFTMVMPPATDTFSTVAATSPTASTEVPPASDDWVMVATSEGATLYAPGPVARQPVSVLNDNGVTYSASDGTTTAGVSVFDLKSDRRADREEFLARLLGLSAERITRVGVKPIVGGDATEFTASDVTGFDHAALVIGRNGRWFVFHIRWKPNDDPKERRRDTFIGRAAVAWVRPEVPPEPVKPKEPKEPKPADPVKPAEPKPPVPKPKDPNAEPEPITETWVAIDNKAGFAAVAPKGGRPERLFVEQKRTHLGGQKWQIDDAHCVYHVSHFDLPNGFDADLPKLVKQLLPFGNELGADSDGKVGDQKATMWQLKQWDKVKAKAVTVRCGFRVFTAFVVNKHGKSYGEDPTFTQRADKFFAGLSFTFDPKADDPYAGEPKWTAMSNTTGFTAKVPKGNSAVKNHDFGFNPKITGQHYRHEADGMAFEVFVHDLPAKRGAADVTKELLGFDKLVSGPEEVRGNDRRWAAYELGGPDRPVLFRTATSGKRVFTIRVYPHGHGDDRAGAREFRDKAAMFFEQFTAED